MEVQIGVEEVPAEGVDLVGPVLGNRLYPKCLRTTAPFLVSAKPLSLACRGRDWVNSTRRLSSILATGWLMYSEPLSAGKPRIRNGKPSRSCRMTGHRYASLICSPVATCAHGVSPSTVWIG